MAPVDGSRPQRVRCQKREDEPVTITLPESMRAEVEATAKAAGFASAQEYVVALIEDDLAGDDLLPPGYVPPAEITFRNREELMRLLDEGMNSGPPIPITPEFWAERRRILEEKLAERRRTSS
jgi:hypothetical protein